MDARLQRRIQRYGWDRACQDYERGWQAQLAPAQALLLQLADLQPGEQVLDVACGTGLLTYRALSQVSPTGAVVGVDLSDAMVEAARRRAALDQAVIFHQMDAESVHELRGPFDATLCALGLMYVADPASALRAQFQILRAGGRAVAAVWGARENCGWQGIFEIVDRRVRSEVCPLFFRLGTGRTLEREFEAAGFCHVETHRIENGLDYHDEEQAIAAAFAGGPVALAYSRFDGATRDEVHREYLHSIAPFRLGSGYRIPGEFVVVYGRRPLGGPASD